MKEEYTQEEQDWFYYEQWLDETICRGKKTSGVEGIHPIPQEKEKRNRQENFQTN